MKELQKFSGTPLPWIDFLRGIAILLIIFHHLPAHNLLVQNVSYAFTASYTGVTLFFILSGIVLYKPFHNQTVNFSKEQIKTYYLKRCFRLYPLFIVNCLVSWLCFSDHQPVLIISSLKALSTFSVFYGNEPFPFINFVLWSLEVEIWFSLLMPLIHRCNLAFSAQKVLIAAFIISFLARAVKISFHLPQVHFLVPENLDAFVTGMFLCRSSLFKDINYQNIRNLVVVFCLLAAGFFLLLKGGFFNEREAALFLYAKPLIPVAVIGVYFVVILITAYVYNTWKYIPGDTAVRIAGKGCFSLYVWHSLLIDSFLTAESGLADYLTFAGVLVLLSSLSYYFIEKIMYNWLRNRFCINHG